MAVEVLTRRLPDLALAPGGDPDYVGSFFFRGLSRLDVEPHRPDARRT
ncbi:cytochrome P450 [Amycolatopsis antarctica]|nr:cytochrome P450 [Amycolatopsis antarctica]